MRVINKADVNTLSHIYSLSFDKSWSAQEFIDLINTGAQGWIKDKAGFILARTAADEAEIITFAVHPSYRGAGLGKMLLSQLNNHLQSIGCKRVFLEVKTSNHIAQYLYCQAGFEQTALRRNYYSLPSGKSEDALIFTLKL